MEAGALSEPWTIQDSCRRPDIIDVSVNERGPIDSAATSLHEQMQSGVVSWFGFLPEADHDTRIQVEIARGKWHEAGIGAKNGRMVKHVTT